jgi:hypothetical protein
MSATVSLIQMLSAGMATSAGLPVASGRCRFYQPGTLTPVTVYADSAAASAITPPLILTAGGTGTAYTQQPTRMIVKDSTDTNTLFDGNVNTNRAESEYIQSTSVNGGAETRMQTLLDAWSTSFGGSAGLWKFKQPGSSVERNLTSVISDFGVSVKSFGAVGDQVTDDFAAFQAAISYVEANGGGVVTVPPGAYLLSAGLTISGTVNVAIRGAGVLASRIYLGSATATLFTVTTSSAGVSFSDLVMSAPTATTGYAVSVTSTAQIIASNIVIPAGVGFGFARAFNFSGTSTSLTVTNCQMYANAIAISMPGGAVYMLGGVAQAPTGISGTSTQMNIVGALVNGTAGPGAQLLGNASIYSSATQYLGTTSSVSVASTAGDVRLAGNSYSGQITDARSTVPVRYSFAVNNSVTPLPGDTENLRVIATAAITVTVNAASPTPVGYKWSITCANGSGGAVVWAFDAIYALAGGAAPAPAAGNMITVTFEYDHASSKFREVTRSGSVAI